MQSAETHQASKAVRNQGSKKQWEIKEQKRYSGGFRKKLNYF
jgi:hypothetical protein